MNNSTLADTITHPTTHPRAQTYNACYALRTISRLNHLLEIETFNGGMRCVCVCVCVCACVCVCVCV